MINKNDFLKLMIFISLLGLCGTPLQGEVLIDNALPETLWFFDVWGTTSQDVYSVGACGKVYHYDGSTWAPVLADALTANKQDLYAISGTSSGYIYLAGKAGTVFACDGAGWTKMNTGTTKDLRDILCFSWNDVYAVGKEGAILHYDGSRWTIMSTPTTRDLWGIWGSTSADLFAVGNSGVILRYNGTAWSLLASNTSRDLRGVWGVDSSHVYAVGAQGTSLQFNGSSWSPFDTSALGWLYLNDIYGFSTTDIYAVGCHGEILHYDGVTWSYATTNHSYTDFNYYGIWGSSSSNVFAVGLGGMVNRYNGTRWTGYRIPDNTIFWLTCMNGTSASDLYLAGYFGNIYHYDGLTYNKMPAPTGSTINDLWIAADKTVFAVGNSGTILYYNGTAWTNMKSNAALHLNGIWGTDKTNIYAVGNYGTVVHYNGTDWQPVTTGSSETFTKIWGTGSNSIYLVGTNGTIVHFDGTTWSLLTSGVTVTLNDIWGVSDQSIYAAGRNGIFLHYNGNSWSQMSIGAHGSLTAIAGTTENNLYVVEETTGYINYFNGTTWQAILTPNLPDGTKNYLYGAWTDKDKNAFFVGVHAIGSVGSLFYYNPVKTSALLSENGLVGCWKFNEGAGATTADESDQKNNGIISGCEWTPAGRFGNALRFTGTSSIDLGTSKLGLDTTNAFTVSLWFRHDGTFVNSISGKLIRRGNYVYPFDLQLQTTERLSVQVRTTAGVNRQDTANWLQSGVWYHAVVTYANGERSFFLNGQEILHATQTGNLYFSSPTSVNHITVGDNFVGVIDEIRIYNRALTVDEVNWLYTGAGK